MRKPALALFSARVVHADVAMLCQRRCGAIEAAPASTSNASLQKQVPLKPPKTSTRHAGPCRFERREGGDERQCGGWCGGRMGCAGRRVRRSVVWGRHRRSKQRRCVADAGTAASVQLRPGHALQREHVHVVHHVVPCSASVDEEGARRQDFGDVKLSGRWAGTSASRLHRKGERQMCR